MAVHNLLLGGVNLVFLSQVASSFHVSVEETDGRCRAMDSANEAVAVVNETCEQLQNDCPEGHADLDVQATC